MDLQHPPKHNRSALQLNVHFHVLVPEGVFRADGSFASLPPPDDDAVHAVLERFLKSLSKLFERRGLEWLSAYPEDALQALQLESAQSRLPLGGVEIPRHTRRCSSVDGFSLHANTRVHQNDRQGLYTLARYGARGPLAEERLEQRDDGRLALRMKRPAPDGSTHLVFTPLQLVRRLVALIPPPRIHLTRFHGAFAPNSKLRPRIVPRDTSAEPTRCSETESAAPERHVSNPSRPVTRVPWAELLKRSFAVDILTCARCKGRRKVLAFISEPKTARAILSHLRLPVSAPTLDSNRATGPPAPQLELPAEF